MANNTRTTMSNKYWENEKPIVTETEFGGVSYFKEAGKIQLYSMYEKDGEICRGKGCTWDNNEMEADDAVRLAYAIMQGLIDVGIESDAFSDAYTLLSEAVANIDEDSDEETETEEELDEEFEDELPPIENMKISELKEVCSNRGIDIPKNAKKNDLVELIRGNSIVDSYIVKEETIAQTKFEFIGENIKYVGGKLSKVKKNAKKQYITFAEESIEWVNYIVESANELSAMPTKTAKQKKEQDNNYSELVDNVAEWISTWEDENIIVELKIITKRLMYLKMSVEEAIVKILAIVDLMDI